MAIRISANRCCSACFPVIRVNCLPTCIGYDPCYLRAMAEAALGNRTQASGASQPAGSFSEVHRRLPWQVLSMYTCPLQYEWSLSEPNSMPEICGHNRAASHHLPTELSSMTDFDFEKLVVAVDMWNWCHMQKQVYIYVHVRVSRFCVRMLLSCA